MQQEHSLKFLRRRKSLLVLPMLVIPFVTMAFWALGGGKNSNLKEENLTNKTGLNLELPGANFKEDKAVDKLGYYEKAASDSAKLRQLIKNDPFFDRNSDGDTLPEKLALSNDPNLFNPYSMNPA